jgi:CelD/BcsL family acetyltransferase involved in cellulose biosynthesis
MSLGVHRVTSWDEFQGLASDWAELTGQSGCNTPFMSHDWFSCCWLAAEKDSCSEIAVVQDAGGERVGFVPLRHRRTHLHGLPVRRLTLMEAPDTPFNDVLAAGDVRLVIRALLGHLEDRSDWDVLELRRLPIASPTLKALQAELDGRLRWRQVGTLASPYLAIDGTWEAYYEARSQRFKKTVRNSQNRLERLGAVSIEEHRSVDVNGELFAEMIDLTARSWKAEHGVAIATMPRMREFFQELTRCASIRGWLSLWLLRLDGRLIAMEYQLQAGGVVNALRADYDMAHAAASPGSVLSFVIARTLFQRGGIQEYDMGPGLNEYKLRWATGSRETVDLEVYRRGVYPRLLHVLETTIVPTARRLREALR